MSNSVISNGPSLEGLDGSYDEQAEDGRMSRADFQHHETQFQTIISKAEKARILFDNPNFNELVVDDYFLNEPVRISGMMASDNITERDEKFLRDDLVAVGKFKNYMTFISRQGYQAQQSLDELYELRDTHGFRGE